MKNANSIFRLITIISCAGFLTLVILVSIFYYELGLSLISKTLAYMAVIHFKIVFISIMGCAITAKPYTNNKRKINNMSKHTADNKGISEQKENSGKDRIVKREEIKDEEFRQMLSIESHHNHQIILDEDGILRWKENPSVRHFLKNISLNDLCPLLISLGYGRNSEVFRKLYRDMGYSLFGYWEVFYWEVNNPSATDYVPNAL